MTNSDSSQSSSQAAERAICSMERIVTLQFGFGAVVAFHFVDSAVNEGSC